MSAGTIIAAFAGLACALFALIAAPWWGKALVVYVFLAGWMADDHLTRHLRAIHQKLDALLDR